MILEILAVYVPAAVTPGPNVLIIVRTAARSRRAALAVAGGVVAGAGVLATAATFGLGAVLTSIGWLNAVLRTVCGLYLSYLGWQLIRTAGRPVDLAGEAAGATLTGSFLSGLLTNLTNPKAAVFFGVVLTAMLPASASVWQRVTAVAMIVCCSAMWHAIVAVVFSTARVRRRYAGAKKTTNRVVGSLLILVGVRIFLRL
jgi:threonine/homoserine/homoserine lactone efflux protein